MKINFKEQKLNQKKRLKMTNKPNEINLPTSVVIKGIRFKVVVKKLKKQGAKPFVFDTNVIYHGKRQNAVDHLNLAYQKGFAPGRIGCPYIIADSVFGSDSIALKADFKNIQEIKRVVLRHVEKSGTTPQEARSEAGVSAV